MKYKFLAHTADLKLRVYGQDYEELFRNGALGLASVLDAQVEKKLKRVRGGDKIEATGDGYPVLVANFLNELLSLSAINKKVYPKVKILKLSPRAAVAQAAGLPADDFAREVKAVSYHDLAIKKTGRQFYIDLTLDI